MPNLPGCDENSAWRMAVLTVIDLARWTTAQGGYRYAFPGPARDRARGYCGVSCLAMPESYFCVSDMTSSTLWLSAFMESTILPRW